MESDKTVTEHLIEAIKRKAWTVPEASKQAGVERSFLSRLMTGGPPPRRRGRRTSEPDDRYYKIANALDLPVDEFIGAVKEAQAREAIRAGHAAGTAPEKKTVFICYAKEDHEMAEKLYFSLAMRGIEAWLDTRSLLPGQRWRSEIEKAIKKSTAFIALLSRNAIDKRGFVQKELKIALGVVDLMPPDSIYLIPARLDPGTPLSGSHQTLTELHWVDLFQNFEEGVSRIVKSLTVAGVIPRRIVNADVRTE